MEPSGSWRCPCKHKGGVTTESVPWLPLPSPQLRNPLEQPCIPTGSRLKQQRPRWKKVNRTNKREFLPLKSLPFQGFYRPDGDQAGKLRAALQVYYDLGTKGLVQKLPKMPQEAPDSNLPSQVGQILAAGTRMSTHSSANREELLFQRKGKKILTALVGCLEVVKYYYKLGTHPPKSRIWNFRQQLNPNSLEQTPTALFQRAKTHQHDFFLL